MEGEILDEVNNNITVSIIITINATTTFLRLQLCLLTKRVHLNSKQLIQDVKVSKYLKIKLLIVHSID